MKYLDISPYTVEIATPNGVAEQDYDVRRSLRVMLFHPELRLSADEALDHHDLAHKIADCPGEVIELEDAEFALIEKTIGQVRGFSEHDIEFIRRIRAAKKEVNVA